jgi:GTPase SAR1 family protein
MELTLVGLQNSGKTTFVDVIAVNHSRDFPSEDP